MTEPTHERSRAPECVWLGNVPLSPVGAAGALALIADWAGSAPFRWVVTPNVDHVIKLQHDDAFREAYAGASLSLLDGRPLLWAARYLGLPPLEKVSGSDLVGPLLAQAAASGWRVFYAGGDSADGLAELFARVRARYPRLMIGGACPPFGFERSPDESARLLAAIRAFAPHLLLMGVGAPKSEIWMARHAAAIGSGIGLGVGMSLHFLTGQMRRAPRWMERTGLEWAWRLGCEPRRLARRYLVDDMAFFPLVWRWKHRNKS